MAALIISLLALGWYMTGLTYYDPDYRWTVTLHKSLGALLFVLALARIAARRVTPQPPIHPNHAPWERRLARLTHGLFYAAFLLMPLSGYLIATADGRPLELLGEPMIPALIQWPGQADQMGKLHNGAAWLLAGLIALHASGALKHHLIDRDNTLRRMFW
ncbi:putative cytochrome b561 [Magnetofaba australis IT-1]|uniref:Putative cytochrome b561 n=2 Tax=Magnetofaba TaxID=1472292 RepID=A0A1Y2K8M4_9PROT|nr:putative cytochrome b561 [Magnetofaba australis IT-1]